MPEVSATERTNEKTLLESTLRDINAKVAGSVDTSNATHGTSYAFSLRKMSGACPSLASAYKVRLYQVHLVRFS